MRQCTSAWMPTSAPVVASSIPPQCKPRVLAPRARPRNAKTLRGAPRRVSLIPASREFHQYHSLIASPPSLPQKRIRCPMGRPRECLCHCGAIRENSLKPHEILTGAEPGPGCLIRNHPINPAVDAKESRFVIYLDYGEFRLRDFWGLRHFLYGIADCDYFPAFELEGSMDDDARVCSSMACVSSLFSPKCSRHHGVSVCGITCSIVNVLCSTVSWWPNESSIRSSKSRVFCNRSPIAYRAELVNLSRNSASLG